MPTINCGYWARTSPEQWLSLGNGCLRPPPCMFLASTPITQLTRSDGLVDAVPGSSVQFCRGPRTGHTPGITRNRPASHLDRAPHIPRSRDIPNAWRAGVYATSGSFSQVVMSLSVPPAQPERFGTGTSALDAASNAAVRTGDHGLPDTRAERGSPQAPGSLGQKPLRCWPRLSVHRCPQDRRHCSGKPSCPRCHPAACRCGMKGRNPR